MTQARTTLSSAPSALPCLLGLLLVTALVFLVPRVTWAGPINIGSISVEPASEIKKFLPLASYLAKQLQPEGVDKGRVLVAESIPQMASFLREGKVDLYIDSPFPSLAVSRLSGSKFLLRRWKKGIGEYHTVIFAKKDSGVSRLEDLRGKIIAFEEPYSSSGYFVPKTVLVHRGLKVVLKKDLSDPVLSDEVGYFFSYDDESTMQWVLRARVAAGAMDNQTYLKEAKGSLDRLIIIDKTSPLPRHIVSVRADLPPRLVARIKDILIKMEQSEEGKKALQDFERTTKFDEIPEEAMTRLIQLQKFIDAEFGLR